MTAPKPISPSPRTPQSSQSCPCRQSTVQMSRSFLVPALKGQYFVLNLVCILTTFATKPPSISRVPHQRWTPRIRTRFAHVARAPGTTIPPPLRTEQPAHSGRATVLVAIEHLDSAIDQLVWLTSRRVRVGWYPATPASQTVPTVRSSFDSTA